MLVIICYSCNRKLLCLIPKHHRLSTPSEYELHELRSLSVLFTFSPRPWWWTNKPESWKSLRNHLGHLIFFFFILSLYPVPRFFFFKQLYWGRICPQFFVCFLGCVLGLVFLATPHGILVAWPEIEPLLWKRGVLTTRPSGKSWPPHYFKWEKTEAQRGAITCLKPLNLYQPGPPPCLLVPKP